MRFYTTFHNKINQKVEKSITASLFPKKNNEINSAIKKILVNLPP